MTKPKTAMDKKTRDNVIKMYEEYPDCTRMLAAFGLVLVIVILIFLIGNSF